MRLSVNCESTLPVLSQIWKAEPVTLAMKPEMALLTFLKIDRPSRSNVSAVSSEEMPELPFCTAPAAVVLAASAVLWAVVTLTDRPSAVCVSVDCLA